MKARTIIILTTITIMVVFILAAMAQKDKTQPENNEQKQPVAVTIQSLQETAFKKSLNVSGTLEGASEALVISETGGRVIALKAAIGDWLSINQTIIQIEADLQAAALEQARAQVLAAETNHEKVMTDLKRAEDLFAQKVITLSDIENARLNAKAAEAELKGAQAASKQAQKQYDNCAIKSPLNGRLADRYVELAAMVAPGTPVAAVVDSRTMKLKSSVSENEVLLIQKNFPALITADAVPGRQFTGRVQSIALKANNERNYSLEILVNNDREETLKSGMFGRASIEILAMEKTIVIPTTAMLIDAQQNHYVFIEKDGVARRVEIGTGMEEAGLVQVSSGLSAGDRLIIAGQQNVKDGMNVRIE